MTPKEYFDFDPNKLKKVKVTEVRPNSWNPKDKDDPDYEKVKKSVELNGLTQPIFVRENDNGETKYEILDGEHRHRAAKDLGLEYIYVYDEGVVPDEYAKSLTIWHEVSVGMREYDLAPLVVELNDLKMELPYNELEIDGFRNLATFDFDEAYKDQKVKKEKDIPDKEVLTIEMTSAQYKTVMDSIDKTKEMLECPDGEALSILCEGGLEALEES